MDEIFRIAGHSAKEELIRYLWWSGLFDCLHKGNYVLLSNIMLNFGCAHVLKVCWHVGKIVILGRGRQSLSAFLWCVLPIIYYSTFRVFVNMYILVPGNWLGTVCRHQILVLAQDYKCKGLSCIWAEWTVC